MPTPHVGALGDRDCIPVPTGRTPPLGPVESFIHSKCDGQRTIAQLGAIASLSVLEVAVLVARLAELGAITLKRPGQANEDVEVEVDSWSAIEPSRKLDEPKTDEPKPAEEGGSEEPAVKKSDDEP